MSARIIAEREWSSASFSGRRLNIEALDETEAEYAAEPYGFVADVVAIGPGRFDVLVLE